MDAFGRRRGLPHPVVSGVGARVVPVVPVGACLLRLSRLVGVPAGPGRCATATTTTIAIIFFFFVPIINSATAQPGFQPSGHVPRRRKCRATQISRRRRGAGG